MKECYKWLTNLDDTKSNPLTRDKILQWVADTGYIEGLVRKKISPMDINLVEDYIQECWLQICKVPEKKLIEIYRKGKGKFTNYIKSIIQNNIRSVTSPLYYNIKKNRNDEVYLDDIGWMTLDQTREAEAIIMYPEKNYDKNGTYKIVPTEDKIKVIADEIY